MKIKLEFEDEKEAKIYLNGKKYFSCLWEFQEYLHKLDSGKEEINKEIDKIEEVFYSILEASNVNLFEIE